jgi:hypothetical protein
VAIDDIEHPHFEARFPLLGLSLWGQGERGLVESWSILSDFLTPTDGWDLTFVDFDIEPTWFELQPVEIYVDNHLHVLGRCDKSRRGGKEGSTVHLWGRDYMADLTTCSLDPSMTIKAGQTLNSALLTAMGPAGIWTLDDPSDRNQERTGGTAGVKVKITDKEVHDYRQRDRDTIFGWSNRLAARHGKTIQPSNRRQGVVLQAPTYTGTPIGKITAKRDHAAGIYNNVSESFAERDYSNVPTYIIGSAQSGRAHEKRSHDSKFEDMNKIIEDLKFTEIRDIFKPTTKGRILPVPTEVRDTAQLGYLYRLRNFRDKESHGGQAQLNGTTARMKAESLKDTLIYEATLKGSMDPASGKSWAYDTLVEVDDDRARVHETLWIAGCNRGVKQRAGCETQITAWRPHTYQIQPEDGG